MPAQWVAGSSYLCGEDDVAVIAATRCESLQSVSCAANLVIVAGIVYLWYLDLDGIWADGSISSSQQFCPYLGAYLTDLVVKQYSSSLNLAAKYSDGKLCVWSVALRNEPIAALPSTAQSSRPPTIELEAKGYIAGEDNVQSPYDVVSP
jgi:hypothetical protein